MKFPVLAAPCLFLLTALNAAPLRFDLSREPDSTRGIHVTAADQYTEERGYGFEPGSPTLFSVRLPEGNHRVRILFGSPEQEGNTTIKAESRRLLALGVHTRKGETLEKEFVVNIRTPKLTPPPKNAPGGTQVDLNDREQGVPHWDEKLTIELGGDSPAVAGLQLEPAPELPTLFLIGDSTVTDQTGEPAAGWGQMLTSFLGPKIAVANHAESGETMKSFLTGHRLDKVLENMKAGDFLMIQFGHNDSKEQWPQTYVDPALTYPAYLRVFIEEARRRGAQPILVTSMHRRRFTPEGRVLNTHGQYPEAVRSVAREMKVPLVDLNSMSARLYEALGPEGSAAAFTDATHHNNYGGYELARCVVEALRSEVPALAALLRPGIPSFDPAHPDPVSEIRIPASPSRMTRPPRGN